jgi:hypothetical protein
MKQTSKALPCWCRISSDPKHQNLGVSIPLPYIQEIEGTVLEALRDAGIGIKISGVPKAIRNSLCSPTYMESSNIRQMLLLPFTMLRRREWKINFNWGSHTAQTSVGSENFNILISAMFLTRMS